MLCEEFIAGLELTCPLLGGGGDAVALPVIRIDAPEAGYDYQNKYFTDLVEYRCPSGLADAEEAEVRRIALAAYRALGCRGWGRADLMLRASDRRPFLLEMNTSPGMTGHSLVPMSARAAGLSYEALCLHLLGSAALDRAPRETAPGVAAAADRGCDAPATARRRCLRRPLRCAPRAPPRRTAPPGPEPAMPCRAPTSASRPTRPPPRTCRPTCA